MSDKITAEIYQQDPDRFSVVSGHQLGAPTCPVGNILQWVGYDKKEDKYVRFTKSVFKKLVAQAEIK
jgi:hypothetical protein